MSTIGQRFLEHHLSFRPVDGTFMGRRECDARLPRADRQALADESRGIAALIAEAATAPDDTAEARLDKHIASAELALAAVGNAERPRLGNPAWYTGEAIFSLIGLLLPQSAPLDVDAVTARLKALPDFLADGRVRMGEAGAAPAGWVKRARGECLALARFLRTELGQVNGAVAQWKAPAQAAAGAMSVFAAAADTLADRDPAAGSNYLSLIMRQVHGLVGSPDGILAKATTAFERLGSELHDDAARLTPGRSWQEAIESLTANTPTQDGVLPAYRHWHHRAVASALASQLVTPATEYELDYRLFDAPFRRIASESYFLFYRSPPAFRPGRGSVYWVAAPGEDSAAYLRGQNVSTLKTTHTVHHGSIGHHTQNARARAAPGVLARIAGTDCASGIALLSAGTMVEGWACYAEDLLNEVDGFYGAAEQLLLKQNQRRNAASVMVDINLHLGRWSLEEAAQFYREQAGFPAHRVSAEIIRNSMFPGSRLMYWCGVEAIKTLRRASSLSTLKFHDALLSFGHVPIAVAAAEMARAEPE